MDERTIPLTPLQRARRGFLKRAALTATGAAGVLPAIGQAGRREKTHASPGNCPGGNPPMKDVEGRVAFITGGSSGIGLGIARAFADARMKVVIGYLTQEHLDEAMSTLDSARGRIHAIRVDVTDRPGMEKAAAETVDLFGKIHVLVNNAGVVGFAPLSSTTYDDWDWVMNVNVNGVFNGVHTFLPRIQAHGEGGQIITTSSMGGLVAKGGAGSYTTSKFAVVGLMEELRADLADTNIGVSVYCPGGVRSNLIDSARNRPTHLSDSGFERKTTLRITADEPVGNSQLVMDPLDAGQLVLQGMRNNDLYILTHPEYEQIMRDRHEVLMSSIPTGLRPPQGRMAEVRALFQHSIYARERERKRCYRG